jgi:hypothetical protein
MKKSILTSLALVLLAFAANAQSLTETGHTVQVNAASVLEIVMTSTSTVELNFLSSDDYENGVTATNAAELKVKSNKGWIVAVTCTATNFDAVNANNDTELLASALKVRKNGTNAYSEVTSGATVASGNKGGHTGNRVFNIDYNLNPGYFAADTYTVPVVYTVSNP